MDGYNQLTHKELVSLLSGLHDVGASGSPPGLSEEARRSFDASPRPMRIFDCATLRYLAVNDAGLALYGYTREEFLALRLPDTRHPGDRANMLSTVAPRLRAIAHWASRRQVTKSGEVLEVETITQDILFDGRFARLSVDIDVTERHRMLALLSRHEQELHTLLAHAPDIVSRLDRDFRHVYVSPAVTAAAGRPPEHFIGKTIDEVGMPPELASRWRSVLETVFVTGREQVLESLYQGPTGTRHYESRLVPELGADGGVATVLTVTRDFTERKRFEELLSAREHEFESLAEHLPDLVARYDRDYRFVYVNSAIEKILGVERERTIGMTQREVGLPGELTALYDDSLAQVFKTGQSHRVEFCLSLPGGERFFEAYHVPEGGLNHPVETVLCVARDITERKRAELAVQRSAALSTLLESLARAANEAVTPEAAMAACLELICSHGSWTLGRVVLYGKSGQWGLPMRSIWHVSDRDGFAGFMRLSEGYVPTMRGSFISRALREQVAVWIEDMARVPSYGRRKAAVQLGLHSAFAFPIIARGEVVAIIEMFSGEVRPQDPLTTGAAQSIASQLARIVEREWAHQANARMAAIVESSHDAIVARALDGTILTWNAGAERLLGYSAAEIIGRNLEILYPAELKARLFGRQDMVLQGKGAVGFETVRLAKDGRRVHVSLTSTPIRDASGEAWGISTIMRDITGRKLAEQELRQAQQHLQIAVRGGAVGLWDWDVESGKVYFSPEWKRQLGYTDEELPNHFEEWDSRLHLEDRARVTATVKKFLARPYPDYQVEYRLRHKDGSYRWILSKASAQLGEGGNIERMFGCHVDITEQKRAEVERLADAMSQRDALVREVHHRIKNSLQGVVGLLRQKVRKYPAILPGIEEAIAQLQSVAVVYGIQGMRPDGTLSLAEMMEAICFSAESLIGGRVEVKLKRESPRPACVAGSEAVSVAVALNELVFNALKHQQAETDKKRVHIVLHETEDAVEVRISNRGSLPKGFDFARGLGMGDGLGLVRTLLSSPGGGLVFNGGRDEVEVVLKLGVPLLAARKQMSVRRIGNGSTTQKRNPPAHTGGRRRPVGAGRAG